MERREFLAQSLRLAALGLATPALFPSCTRDAPGRLGSVLAASHSLSADGKGTLFQHYDLDAELVHEISLPLEFPHVAVGRAGRESLVLVPESAGRSLAVVDLGARGVARTLVAGEGRVFGGHCVFSSDGSRFYASEFEPAPSGKGFVSEWSADTFQRLRSFPTHGRFPHDVALGTGGAVVHATNLGAEVGSHVKASGIFVSRLSLTDGALLERIELCDDPSELNLNAEVGKAGWVARDEVVRTDARYFVAAAHVAMPKTRYYFYPDAHRPVVTMWDLEKLRLVREFEFEEQPRALAVLPTRGKVAVALASGRLVILDVERREVDARLAPQHRLQVHTHLNAWGSAGSYG